MAKLSALRRLPSAVGLSAAGSLYFSAPSGVPTTVGGYILIAGLAAWLLSLFPFAAKQLIPTEAICGDSVGCSDDGVAIANVIQASSCGAALKQHAAAVEKHEGRAHHQRKVGDNGVDVLVKLIAPSAE